MSKAEPEGPYVYQPYGVFEQPYAQDGRIYGVGGIDPPIRGVNKWLAEAITAAIREAVEAERKACAEVAELYAKEIQSHGHLPLDPFECAAESGKEIASAIKARSNDTPSP